MRPIAKATNLQIDPDTGAVKADGSKLRYELLPYDALDEVAAVMTVGALKYHDRNWEAGMRWSRVLGSALRHITAWAQGQNHDPETGYSHLAHAACCILFLLAYEQRSVGTDDRAKTKD
jgi:hypothetical protein